MQTAVLIMNYGGPTKAQECGPYLKNIFMDPDLIPMSGLVRPLVAALASSRRAPQLQQNYGAMGRYSPILEETRAQAAALEKALGEGFHCMVGMRYWKPFIADACEEISRGGFGRIVLLPLYPHESNSTTGSSINEARRCIRKLEYAGEIREVRSFWEDPGYLEAFAAGVSSALERAPEGTRVLFSAHGLPLSVARKDLYPGQIAATVQEVSRRLNLLLDAICIPGAIPDLHAPASCGKVRSEESGGRREGKETDAENGRVYSSLLTPTSSPFKGTLAWQSKVGPMKWLEPSVETVLERWARENVKELVLVPVSFVNEHSETLYELDVLYAGKARHLGMTVRRVPALGTTPAFIDGLANRVRSACGAPA